jgi:hypothetical protein
MSASVIRVPMGCWLWVGESRVLSWRVAGGAVRRLDGYRGTANGAVAACSYFGSWPLIPGASDPADLGGAVAERSGRGVPGMDGLRACYRGRDF